MCHNAYIIESTCRKRKRDRMIQKKQKHQKIKIIGVIHHHQFYTRETQQQQQLKKNSINNGTKHFEKQNCKLTVP